MQLTQADVAERVGLVPEVYGRLERGHMAPSIQSLRRICVALDLSADLLLSLGAAARAPSPAARPAPVSPPSRETAAISRLNRRVRRLSPRSLRLLSQFAAVLGSSEGRATRSSRAPSSGRASRNLG
jgi:transcriptional regulator with XRE-family HTH domain